MHQVFDVRPIMGSECYIYKRYMYISKSVLQAHKTSIEFVTFEKSINRAIESVL